MTTDKGAKARWWFEKKVCLGQSSEKNQHVMFGEKEKGQSDQEGTFREVGESV